MSLIKKSDLKNHLSTKRQKVVFLHSETNQPTMDRESRDNPVALRGSRVESPGTPSVEPVK